MKKKNRYTYHILCIAVLFFATLLFNGKLIAGYVVYGADNSIFYYPFFSLFKIRPFPLWNPYQFAGMPLIGNPQYAMFYPLRFLFYLFDVKYIYGPYCFIHYFLAAVFMYVLLKGLRLSYVSSLFGSLIFAFGSFIQGRISNPSLFFSAVWFPLPLLFTILAFEKKSVKFAILSGISLALLAFAGSPHNVFYSYFMVCLFFIYHPFMGNLFFNKSEELMTDENRMSLILKRLKRNLFILILITIIFLGFYSISLTSTIELTPQAVRSEATFDDVVKDPLEFKWIDNLFLGGTQVPEYTDKTTYGGMVATFIIILSLILKRDKRYVFPFVLMISGILFALGKYGGFYHLIYAIPQIRFLIGPARSLILFVVAFSLISSIAFENLISNFEKIKNSRITFFFAMLSVITGVLFLIFSKNFGLKTTLDFISYPKYILPPEFLPLNIALFIFLVSLVFLLFSSKLISHNAIKILLILLLVTDLYHFNMRVFTYYSTPDYFNPPSTIRFIKDREKSEGVFRVLGYESARLHASDINDARAVGFIMPKLPDLFRIQEVQGYDPLMLKDYVKFISTLAGRSEVEDPWRTLTIKNPYSSVINLMNVKYIIGNPNEFSIRRAPPISPLSPNEKDKVIDLSIQEKCEAIGIVSILDNALDVLQGDVVGFINVYDDKDQCHKYPVRAGIETADWRIDDNFFKAKHKAIAVANRWIMNFDNRDKEVYNYISKIKFEESFIPTRIEFVQKNPGIIWVTLNVTICKVNDESRFRKVFDDGEYEIYENLKCMTRAFLIHNVEKCEDREAVLKRMTGENVDFSQVAFVMEDIRKLGDRRESSIPGFNDSVKIISYTPNRIQIETESNSDALLVLSDTYYPGWKVKVDGEYDRLLQVNYILRGVYLSKGKHNVLIYYKPKIFVLGIIIGIITLFIVFILLVLENRMKKPSNNSISYEEL